MRLLARVIAPLFFALTFSITVRAATVTNVDLPGSIQSCITAVTCFVENASSYHSGTASAFQIYQNTGSGWESNWLMRYTLVSPSNGGGYLWMLAKNSYSTSETAHPFTLYLDKIIPAPNLYFGDSNQSGGLDLYMPSADLVAGGSNGTYVTGYGAGDSLDMFHYGSLSGEFAPYCLQPDCVGSAQLNLVQLTYENFGSTIELTAFDPSDTRGLVYTQSVYIPAEPPNVQSFYVSAVPLPSAVWLFGSGLAGLIGVMRSARRR